jgi:hypothetical protein
VFSTPAFFYDVFSRPLKQEVAPVLVADLQNCRRLTASCSGEMKRGQL